VFENRVLRKIFGLKRDEVTGGEWRKLHNEELRDLYSCEFGIEPSGSMKCWETIEWLNI
jgi:PAS domain-containing protein